MSDPDVLVVGGGIGGAALAYHAAAAGRSVRVVEREAEPGGCLASRETAGGFWYELGAHTAYNSYGAFLEVLEGCGLLGSLQPREKPVLRFLDGERVVRGKNLSALLRLSRKVELLRAVPRWRGASQEGATVRAYYGRLVGERNYERVLRPMLSAVPSQCADEFPADMLFKRRERRKDVMRSFTLPGGLGSAVRAALARPGIDVVTGTGVAALAREGAGFAATLDSGERVRAAQVALAVPPSVAARLLNEVAPAASAAAARVAEASIDSVGLVVARERVEHVPLSTFLIPLEDAFHSVVTRDVVPDETWRAFTFHFRPGYSAEGRLERAGAVLGIGRRDIEEVRERRTVLPSPRLGHSELVREIDGGLAGSGIAVTGNWFGGLSIEDCALRSRDEWRRLSAAQ